MARHISATSILASSIDGIVEVPLLLVELTPMLHYLIDVPFINQGALLVAGWVLGVHSMTSSARPMSESGTESPSAFAVLRLMTSSTFTAC